MLKVLQHDVEHAQHDLKPVLKKKEDAFDVWHQNELMRGAQDIEEAPRSLLAETLGSELNKEEAAH